MDLRRGCNSYIKSPQWLIKKRATINPKNEKDDSCSQYAITALNYQNIRKDHQRISKIKPFINQYNWKGIEFPSQQEDWKNLEQNNKTVAVNILFVPCSTEEISLAYKSKCNNECENQVILLMITDGQKWHYLALKSERIFYGRKWCNRSVKGLSALLRGITSNYNGDFYCFNCFHLYSTENSLKEHEEKCNKHDYCRTEIPKWFEKILKYNRGEKSSKISFFISFDDEVLSPKMLLCQNNPEKYYTDKKANHILSDCAWSLTC